MATPDDIYNQKLSAYRIMWVIVMFDLPTRTKLERKHYSLFRKFLVKDGFMMLQFSVYARHCSSRDNLDTHFERISRNLPPAGRIKVLQFTDKQWGETRTFYGTGYVPPEEGFGQLVLF